MANTKRAIQQDVQDQETNTGIEATPNPRNDFLEQLAANNHEIMQNDLEGQGFIEEAAAAKEATGATPEPAEQPNTDPQLLSENDLANMRVKTKVDGIEEVHSVADVLKSYQKDSAASKRLEEVARRQTDLEAREAALLAREAALQATPTPADNTLPNQDEAVSKMVAALYEGDEDKTKEAFKTLLGQREPAIAPQVVDTATIATQVRQQIAQEQAMADFGKTYQEIVASPYLAQVADTYLAQELQGGTELNVALTKAGDSTRAWVKQQLESAVNVASPDDKLARKSTLDNLPTASARSLSPDTSNEGEGNASAIIAEMRKARGLPT